MDTGPILSLGDDVQLPVLGFGTWQIPDGAETEAAVAAALWAGYRHIDTAQAYGNEESVGRALSAGGIARDQVFVTTKFNPRLRDPVAEAERSLERLGTGWIDLYLVHDPGGGATSAWAGMQRALERGLARAIGVSNFDVGELGEVCAAADVLPAVNQIQLSPFEYRRALLAECERLGVAVEAWSPLTSGRDLGDPTVGEIAAQIGRTPAQVLLRWGVQRGAVVLPKSTHPERIAENARIFDFELGGEEVAKLDSLDRTGGTGDAVEDKWWTAASRARGLLSRIAGRVRG
jgi:diketogulonate reductase-like aldo/keto reductase